MRALKTIIFLALPLALLLLYVSFKIAPDQGPGFWVGFLINLAAGLLILVTGLAATLMVASSLARDKLGKLAPKLMKLIRQLREDKTISSQAARYAVICSVGLITEKYLEGDRAAADGTGAKAAIVQCNVCALPSETEPDKENGVRCWHCKLPGKEWQLAEGEVKSLKEQEEGVGVVPKT